MEEYRNLEQAFHDLVEIVSFTGELSARLHGGLEEAEVMAMVVDRFAASKKYTASILLLTEDGKGVRIGRTSLGRRETRAGEKAAAVRLDSFKIDLDKATYYRQVAVEGKTVTPTAGEIVEELFPLPLARLLNKMLACENRQAVLTPIRRHGEIIGVLAISAPSMPEYFIPSVQNLAHHISAALEGAEQHSVRRRAVDELRASEARYKALFEQAADSIVLADGRNGLIVDFNNRAYGDLGYTREEFAQLSIHDFQAPESAEKLLGEGLDAFETLYRSKGGDAVDVLVSSRSISIAGKEFVQIAWRDITSRKRDQEALARSEERYRSLVSNIPDVVWTTDREGVTTFISPNVEKVIGYTQQDVYEGGPDVWLANVHPNDVEEVRRAFANLFEEGTPYDVQYRYRRKDGTWVWLHDRAVSLYQREGRDYADGLLSDITDLRAVQEKALLQEKLAVMGQLAGGVGHELRNPLGAIKNAAYFLRMALENPEPDVREAIEILHREVDTSENIISSLLGFARPQPPARRRVDVNEILEQALSRTSVPENVKVVRQLGSSLPNVQGDPGQLDRLFGNIILNAVQAMPEGGELTVQTSKARGKPRGAKWISVSVSDTGVGIRDEHMDRLFQPLFTTKAKGIGLGLALASTLAEAHGGDITVCSELGKGSTFTVRLPVGGVRPPDEGGGPP